VIKTITRNSSFVYCYGLGLSTVAEWRKSKWLN